jgi:hypothetical protein
MTLDQINVSIDPEKSDFKFVSMHILWPPVHIAIIMTLNHFDYKIITGVLKFFKNTIAV